MFFTCKLYLFSIMRNSGKSVWGTLSVFYVHTVFILCNAELRDNNMRNISCFLRANCIFFSVILISEKSVWGAFVFFTCTLYLFSVKLNSVISLWGTFRVFTCSLYLFSVILNSEISVWGTFRIFYLHTVFILFNAEIR